MSAETQIKRWRLILGETVEEKLGTGGILDDEESLMDAALAMIYGGDGSKGSTQDNSRKAGKGPSSPNLAKWLVDVRNFFPTDVVSVIQSDAIERKGLRQLLFEPETLKNVKPDVSMVSTLMSLRGQIPAKSKDTARELVKAVVYEIMKRMEQDLRRAVTGALNKKVHSPIPNLQGLDWKRTVSGNLKNYNVERGKLIPDRFWFFERQRRSKEWTVIIDLDQSGSMADSIVYSSVMGAIFASMPSLDTHVVAFDTNIVDLTEQVREDPVEMLFGIQLGGGTDINKSVKYCRSLIIEPKKTLFILVSDLYEGGVEAQLVRQLEEIHESGVKCMVLLALSDGGKPMYDEQLGKRIAKLGIPSFACSPDKLPELVEGAIKGFDLMELSQRVCSTVSSIRV
ncbi:MAG: VWA domain-containing protein [Oscillospiraceae bacterium]|jgi:hypothetical protein|nr:VWA domain-containing protein [Oscillospiraceae bacterium]